MIEAEPLNYPKIIGITIVILIIIVLLLSSVIKVIWRIPYKVSLSHHVGCLWAIILFFCGIYVFGKVKQHYTCPSVIVHIIDENGNIVTKKYEHYFLSPNNQQVTYEEQKGSKGYYVYNSSNSIIEVVSHFYGENQSGLPTELVTNTIFPGDLVNLVLEPDYIFTPAPSTVSIRTHNPSKLKSVTRTEMRFRD